MPRVDRQYNSALSTIYAYERSIGIPRKERTVRPDEKGLRLQEGNEVSQARLREILEYAEKCADYLAFGVAIEKTQTGRIGRYDMLQVSPELPEIMQRVGLENVPLYYGQKHARKALTTYNSRKHNHGFTSEQIRRLPELMETPLVVYDAPSNSIKGNGPVERPAVVMLLNESNSYNKPLIAVIKPSYHAIPDMNSKNEPVGPGKGNLLLSTYFKRDIAFHLGKAAKEGKLLYVDHAQFENKNGLLRVDKTQCLPALEGHDGMIHHSRYATGEIHEESKGTQTQRTPETRQPHKSEVNADRPGREFVTQPQTHTEKNIGQMRTNRQAK